MLVYSMFLYAFKFWVQDWPEIAGIAVFVQILWSFSAALELAISSDYQTSERCLPIQFITHLNSFRCPWQSTQVYLEMCI